MEYKNIDRMTLDMCITDFQDRELSLRAQGFFSTQGGESCPNQVSILRSAYMWDQNSQYL
jgi:hypothetical protein